MTAESDLRAQLVRTLNYLKATGARRMPHWKTMHDPSKMLSAVDLDGKEVTVTIESVVAGDVIGEGGKTSKMPLVTFTGKTKQLALNKTNSKAIAKMYGNYTEKWAGKAVTLYPTQTKLAGDTVDCIRIRPVVPK